MHSSARTCVESIVEPQRHSGSTEDGPWPHSCSREKFLKQLTPPLSHLALAPGSLETTDQQCLISSPSQERCRDACSGATRQEVSLTWEASLQGVLGKCIIDGQSIGEPLGGPNCNPQWHSVTTGTPFTFRCRHRHGYQVPLVLKKHPDFSRLPWVTAAAYTMATGFAVAVGLHPVLWCARGVDHWALDPVCTWAG